MVNMLNVIIVWTEIAVIFIPFLNTSVSEVFKSQWCHLHYLWIISFFSLDVPKDIYYKTLKSNGVFHLP